MLLPAELPGSFHYNSCGLHARIFYKLEAEITVPGLLRRNLHSETFELKLLQFPSLQVMPLQVIRELPVSSLLCLAQGNIQLAVSLDKNIYSPADTVCLKLALDQSQCFQSIQSLQVRLIRVLRFGNAQTSQNRSESRVLDLSKSRNLKRETGNDIIYRRTSLKVPANTPLSLKGRLIECQYELEFRIKIDWSWSVSSRIVIPVEETHLPQYSNIPARRITEESPIK